MRTKHKGIRVFMIIERRVSADIEPSRVVRWLLLDMAPDLLAEIVWSMGPGGAERKREHLMHARARVSHNKAINMPIIIRSRWLKRA